MDRCGTITLITGCMWAGKSTKLLRLIDRYRISEKRVLLIKPKMDIRYSVEAIESHVDHAGKNHSVLAVPVDDLEALDKNEIGQNYDVIGIDEGNFFGPEIVKFCDYWAFQGKMVIVAALNGSFQREHFGHIHHLYPKAESIIKLKAICFVCKEKANFTDRKTCDTEERKIGGKELYQALCRNCWKRKHMPE